VGSVRGLPSPRFGLTTDKHLGHVAARALVLAGEPVLGGVGVAAALQDGLHVRRHAGCVRHACDGRQRAPWVRGAGCVLRLWGFLSVTTVAPFVLDAELQASQKL